MSAALQHAVVFFLAALAASFASDLNVTVTKMDDLNVTDTRDYNLTDFRVTTESGSSFNVSERSGMDRATFSEIPIVTKQQSASSKPADVIASTNSGILSTSSSVLASDVTPLSVWNNTSAVSVTSVNEPAPAVTLTSCEMTTERRLSVIQSPGFPSPYASDVECRYAVRRYSLDVCSVTFLFNVFDLEASEACSKDYVDLHGERLCGAKTTGLTRSVPFRSVEDQVILRFRSDASTSGVGFMATVVQQECPPPDCDHQFTGIHFEVRSPGFPGPYENRQLCDYTVVRVGPRICRIRLQVRVFDVEASEHCDADSLEIRGDKLCGNIAAGEIVSVEFREPLLMLRFRSDHTTTRDGFHLLGTQEECPDGETTTSSNVTAETGDVKR